MLSGEPEPQIASLLAALDFAAIKHCGQTRKKDAGPFINHPIAVAELLARVGEVRSLSLLQAAFLHDVLEDTPTLPGELSERFGPEILSIVLEVTDDMALPKEVRKQRQIEGAASLSKNAKQIRIADKICNIRDLSLTQPGDWTVERKLSYLEWAQEVVDGCRGCNPKLEREFDRLVTEKQTLFTQF